MSLEQIITRAWYQDQAWVRVLRPLSWLYKQALQRRRQGAHTHQHSLPVPVVVVGNITVGGTGKTPLIIYLCQQLTAMGISVGVVSRGYGAKIRDYPYSVSDADNSQQVGDEPLMIYQQAGVPVVIAPDRFAAAKHLIELNRVEVILSDDGMQHFALPRDLEILVVDGNRQLGNELLLPAGPLREPVDRLHSVDFCLLNGPDDTSPLHSSVLAETLSGAFRLVPKRWIHVTTGKSVGLDSLPPSEERYAVAGIGNPQRFFNTLESLGLSAECIALDDHQPMDEALLMAIGAKKVGTQVLMTTKDAVKCRQIATENCWALDVQVHIDQSLEAEILSAIRMLLKVAAKETLGEG